MKLWKELVIGPYVKIFFFNAVAKYFPRTKLTFVFNTSFDYPLQVSLFECLGLFVGFKVGKFGKTKLENDFFKGNYKLKNKNGAM